jgi:hypothetical protein
MATNYPVIPSSSSFFISENEPQNNEENMNDFISTQQSDSNLQVSDDTKTASTPNFKFQVEDELERERIKKAENTFLPPEVSQRKLHKALDTFISGEHKDVIIKAEAGLGKSTAVIDKVITGEKKVFYFVPTHNLAEELFDKIKKEKPELKGLVFKGRTRDGMCRNSELQNIVNAGVSVSEYGCLKCDHFETCPYISQIERIPASDYVILAHDYLVFPFSKSLQQKLEVTVNPDLLVIDESFRSKFVEIDKIVSVKTLKAYRHLSKNLLDIDNRRSEAPIVVIDAIVNSIKNKKPMLKTLRDSRIDYKFLKAAQKSFNNSVFKSKKDDAVKKRFEKFRKSNIGDLFGCLISEISRDRITPQQVVVNQNNNDTIHLYLKKRFAFDEYDLETGRNIGCSKPILVIDADANRMLVSRFIGKNKTFKYFPIRTKRQSYITQIKNKSFFTGGLVEGRENANDIDDINNFIKEKAKAKKVLVICPKKIEHRIQHAEVEHFGNIKGIDKYKDHDCLVLIGRNQPPVVGVENEARAVFGDMIKPIDFINDSDEGRFRTGYKNYKMKSGENSKRTLGRVPYHPDYRCQVILSQIRESESTQAISRLRDIWGKNKEVFILSNVVLDIEIDELKDWSDFKNGSKMDKLFDRIDLENEVLPFTDAVYMSQQHPDLFKNKNTYKNEQKKFKKNNNGQDLKSFYIELLPSLTEYKFKLPCKKRWSFVLSPFEIDETERHLVKMYSSDVAIEEIPVIEKAA